MKRLLTLLFVLLLNGISFAQIDPMKIWKPNLNDKFEEIVFQENVKLDSDIYKTAIWISDEYDNEYNFKYGIIINKKKIQNELSSFNNVNLRFIIRIIIAHEKMHARQYSKFTSEELDKYLRLVSKEQRRRDEAQADIIAGYYSFDIKNFEDVKYQLKIIKAFQEQDFNKDLNLSESEYSFLEALRSNEINALKLFFSMGENQNYVVNHPSSYQRTLAFEMGVKAAAVTRFFNYVSDQWKTFSENEKTLYKQIIEKLENDIQYKCVKEYLYGAWSIWTADKILNTNKSLNKHITFNLLNKSIDRINNQILYTMNITNANKKDSILVNYSILLTGKPYTELTNYTILSAINRMIKLAPNETKKTVDSLDIGLSDMLSDGRNEQISFKVVYPGQIGSLYYSKLLNKKNGSKYYADDSNISYRECEKCIPNLEDLLKNIIEIHKNFEARDLEDYVSGIGFKNINVDYISYSTFIRNRPFDLLAYSNNTKQILVTTVFTDQNLNVVKKYLSTIIQKLEKQGSPKILIKKDQNGFPIISLIDDMKKEIGTFNISHDDIFNESKIELSLIKQ